jgi:hypothetical protein
MTGNLRLLPVSRLIRPEHLAFFALLFILPVSFFIEIYTLINYIQNTEIAKKQEKKTAAEDIKQNFSYSAAEYAQKIFCNRLIIKNKNKKADRL